MSATQERQSPVPKLTLQAGQGDHLGRTDRRIDTPPDAKTQVLTAAAQYVANHAMIAASVCLHLCAGRSPEQVAAEIAGRAVRALKGKGGTRA